MSSDSPIPRLQTDDPRDISLFRQEALEIGSSEIYGNVIVARPLSFIVMSAFAAGTIISICLFAIFGTYTKKNSVVGQIVPAAGIVRVYSPQTGIILASKVTEGEHVSAGAVLFKLSSDKLSMVGNSQAFISQSILRRQMLLGSEEQRLRTLLALDKGALERKITAYEQEIDTIRDMIKIQNARVDVSADLAERYRQLLKQQFVSDADVQAKEAELLDQRSRLKSLEKDRDDATATLVGLRSELSDLPLKTDSNINTVEGEIQSDKEDLSSSESKRSVEIIAPISGIASTITVHIGDAVDTSQPLISILPQSGRMQAQLYATSKEVGFVKVGDEVDLRYEAYPYEMFGVYGGRVIMVSRTVLTPSEVKDIGDLILQRSPPGERGAPLYRITVAPDSQALTVEGKVQPLQAGMLVDADIRQETRRLYQWVLEPLYAYMRAPSYKQH